MGILNSLLELFEPDPPKKEKTKKDGKKKKKKRNDDWDVPIFHFINK